MTYEECKKTIAVKYQLGTTLVTGHRASYFEEAAILYASQQREEGIREGFEAARVFVADEGRHCGDLYPTVNDYINSK